MLPERGSVGRIVAFYSYKGGTGRSMALANIGFLLAKEGARVLMVDWDLEAPGLHRYFRNLMQTRFPDDRGGEQFERWPGLVDFLLEARGLIAGGAASDSQDDARRLVEQVAIDRFILQTDLPSLYLLKAGCFNNSYAGAVCGLDWERLHNCSPWLFRAFSDALAERFSYVLIDSRTGITDTSGICTSIMPDTLVVVFTPNLQSLLGAVEVAAQAVAYRKNSDDLRPLNILPLASRIEGAEPLLRDLWRFGDPQQSIPGYQPAFEGLFRTIYDLPVCDLAEYFSEVQVQHIPRYAYGEQIAVRIESGDRLSLTRSFEGFAQRLQSGSPPWERPRDESPAETESQAESTPSRDDSWLERQRAIAMPKLEGMGASGFMEAYFFLVYPADWISQKQLFQAAQAAQVPGTGWPIGAVMSTSQESRPRPIADGIAAEIVEKSTDSYDYWTLREDGAFYFIRNLEEDAEYLLADDRVERMAELLVYGSRLYSFLRVDQSARLKVSVSFKGLSGRALGRRMPDKPDAWYPLAGVAAKDSVSSGTTLEIGRIREDIVPLVTELTRSLFVLFDFYELPVSEYAALIDARLQDWGFTRPGK